MIGDLIAAEMTPHAVELALEIQERNRKPAMTRPIGSGGVPSNALRSMPSLHSVGSCWLILGNRLVADTLEREWNDKLRILAGAQEEQQSARPAPGPHRVGRRSPGAG